MNRNIAIAIVAAVIGALIVFLYNFIKPPLVRPLRPPQACGHEKCDVSVSVYEDNCNEPNNIQAAPPDAPIKKGNSPRIEWTIVNNGYTFASNGIDFHGDPQFHHGGPVGSTKFQWFDDNTDTLYHKYTINLLHAGVPCPPLDPGIINGQ